MCYIINSAETVVLEKKTSIAQAKSQGGRRVAQRRGPALYNLEANVGMMGHNSEKQFSIEDELIKLDYGSKTFEQALVNGMIGGNLTSPRGSWDSTPTVNGLNQSGNSINVSTSSNNITGYGKVGDYVQFSNSTKVYQLTADADTSGGGLTTLHLNAGIVNSPTNGSDIVFGADVSFNFALISSTAPMYKAGDLVEYGKFVFEEVIEDTTRTALANDITIQKRSATQVGENLVSSSYTHPNHTGDVLSAGDGAITINDDVIDVDNLKTSNTPTNGQVLVARDGTTEGWTWEDYTGGGSTLTIEDEGTALTTDATTLDFVGAGVTVTGTGSTKTVTVINGGPAGDSAYEVAVDNGFSGTEAQWLTSLESTVAGPAGQDGTDGTDGVDGTDGADGVGATMNVATYTQNSSQTITSTTSTTLNIENVGEEDSIYSNSNGVVTLSQAGTYRVFCNLVGNDAGTSNYRFTGQLDLFKNSSTLLASTRGMYIRSTNGSVDSSMTSDNIITVAANDTIEMKFKRLSSTQGNAATVADSTTLQIVKLDGVVGTQGIQGIQGPAGPKGDTGDSGGVPDGGTIGQILKKNSSTDGDADWTNPGYLETDTTGGLLSQNFIVKDNNTGKWGTGGDFEMKHDGTSEMVMINQTGDIRMINHSGDTKIQSPSQTDGISVLSTGEVELYYDGTKRLETTSTGTDIDGTFTVKGNGTSKSIEVDSSSNMKLFANGTERIALSSSADAIEMNATNVAFSGTVDGVNLPDLDGAVTGGTTGQVLTKNSGTDYDTTWADASGGSMTDIFYFGKETSVLEDQSGTITLDYTGTVVHNIGSGMNTSTGVFTAPEDGYYQVNASIWLYNGESPRSNADGKQCKMQCKQTYAAGGDVYYGGSILQHSSSNSPIGPTFNNVLRMSDGDYFDILLNMGDNTHLDSGTLTVKMVGTF